MKLKGISSQRLQHLFPSQSSRLGSPRDSTPNRLSRQFISVVSTPKKVNPTGIKLERKVRISMDNLYKLDDVRSLQKAGSNKYIESTTTLARTFSSKTDNFAAHKPASLEASRASSKQHTIIHNAPSTENTRAQQIYNTYYKSQESTRAQSRTDSHLNSTNSHFNGKSNNMKRYDIRRFVKY